MIDKDGFDENKKYWYVEVKDFTYRANNLTEVLLLWHQHRNRFAKDDVINVGSMG